MRKTSIVILSYNTLSYTQLCIDSIRAYTKKKSYEIIVVDNASTDGSLAWLREQIDIKLIANTENVGFPAGCNQGMKAAEPGNDLLLLNSDIIVTAHWLDNLQQALYSGKDIGAVSCVTNNCSNGQSIKVDYQTVEELQQFAAVYNNSNAQKWYSWPTLVGFCFLLKREVYDKVGGMDERYTPGNYEDDDYSYTIRQKGYRLLLCADTFIHHFGSASFKQALDSGQAQAKQERFAKILKANEEKFMQKWQVSPDHKVFHGITEVLQPEDAGKHVLLVRCSVGLDLCNLQRKYPQLHLSGLVLNEADKVNAVQDFSIRYVPQWENISAAIPARQDIILVLGNVRTIPDSKRVLEKLARRLKPLGKLYYYDEQHSYCEQRNIEDV